MTVSISTLAASDKNYTQKINNNFTALKSAVEALQAAILGSVGAGAQLVTDLFDRAGVVGTHSYVLDIDNYAGGVTIDIGRRPAPNLDFNEADVSIAWGNFAGTFDRVTLTGDVTLDASAITTSLPKTIYVAVAANGVPQLFEADNVPNVVYLYSMTWDGGSLSDFVRLAHILPAYSLIAAIASRPQLFDLFDSETDWVSDEAGMTSILLPGATADNALAEMSYEVIGFYVNVTRADEDGFYATEDDPDNADRNHVKFKVTSEGEDWTSEDFDLDCSDIPDFQFVAVSTLLSDSNSKFVTEARTFELERTYLGDFVESARAFQWGVVVRPIYGPALPKNGTFVDQI